MEKNKKKTNYIYSENITTNENNDDLEKLTLLFNQKMFKTILKIEKLLYEGCNV